MQTPIINFIKEYESKKGSRFHMPGHKGQAFLGCESLDITEIAGADALYEAEGMIAESEKNASKLFGTAKTLFSTEGSSQCIRAMMKLVIGYQNESLYKAKQEKEQLKQPCGQTNMNKCAVRGFGAVTEAEKIRPYVIAARNVHKAFLYAAALVDFDVVWLYPKEMHSLCSCEISVEQVEAELCRQVQKKGILPAAVYVTSPDYLGGQLDIKALAEICHHYGTVLAVDNAHGAYLHFLKEKSHPIDLGADICCDSAHKTLPVLTGGAYLQIGKIAPDYFVQNAKQAMVLFGSTSPSYLIMGSLDLCNAYLSDGYEKKLEQTIQKLENLRESLRKMGWCVEQTDPLKLTIRSESIYVHEQTGNTECECSRYNMTGVEIANELRKAQIECEYADKNYLVLMATPENAEEDFEKLEEKMQEIAIRKKKCVKENNKYLHTEDIKFFHKEEKMQPLYCEQKISIREAIFSNQEQIKTKDSVGRICGIPIVSCPPAIPIVVAGELINEEAVKLFAYYGIETVSVVKITN